MLTFLTWFDNDLPKLLTDIDRFNDILKRQKQYSPLKQAHLQGTQTHNTS
jgi:hypothetical protein